MSFNTFEKGDLIEIPAGVHLSKADCDSFSTKPTAEQTKKPTVGIYVRYNNYDKTATILFSNGEWVVPSEHVQWPSRVAC